MDSWDLSYCKLQDVGKVLGAFSRFACIACYTIYFVLVVAIVSYVSIGTVYCIYVHIILFCYGMFMSTWLCLCIFCLFVFV